MSDIEVSTATEGRFRWGRHETWYRVVGDLRGAPPLIVCHGGPGATHDYLSAVAGISATGRACVLYDQVGNGNSSRHPDAPGTLWSVELFLRELELLLDHLDVAASYHLLGHSWGGMLAMEHALRQPAGLRSIVIADAPASTRLWAEEAVRLMSELPTEVRAVLDHAHTTGNTDTPAYAEASEVYYRRHVCRIVPPPPEVERTFAALSADPTVYATMVGPSEMEPTGTLKDWDITGRLDQIRTPSLVLSGRYDEATPAVVRPIAEGIPAARWVLFEGSSHMPHIEEEEAYLRLLGEFLAEHDR